jgi:hypothetical protein
MLTVRPSVPSQPQLSATPIPRRSELSAAPVPTTKWRDACADYSRAHGRIAGARAGVMGRCNAICRSRFLSIAAIVHPRLKSHQRNRCRITLRGQNIRSTDTRGRLTKEGAAGRFRSRFPAGPRLEEFGDCAWKIRFTEALEQSSDIHLRSNALDVDANRNSGRDGNHGPPTRVREIEIDCFPVTHRRSCRRSAC